MSVQNLISRAFSPSIQFYLMDHHILTSRSAWARSSDLYIASAHNRSGGVFHWYIRKHADKLEEGQGSEAGVFAYRMGLSAITSAVAISAAIKRHNRIAHRI